MHCLNHHYEEKNHHSWCLEMVHPKSDEPHDAPTSATLDTCMRLPMHEVIDAWNTVGGIWFLIPLLLLLLLLLTRSLCSSAYLLWHWFDIDLSWSGLLVQCQEFPPPQLVAEMLFTFLNKPFQFSSRPFESNGHQEIIWRLSNGYCQPRTSGQKMWGLWTLAFVFSPRWSESSLNQVVRGRPVVEWMPRPEQQLLRLRVSETAPESKQRRETPCSSP